MREQKAKILADLTIYWTGDYQCLAKGQDAVWLNVPANGPYADEIYWSFLLPVGTYVFHVSSVNCEYIKFHAAKG